MMQDTRIVIEDIDKICVEMRKDILLMTFSAGQAGGHLGGSLSIVEILAVLYLSIMKYDITDPFKEERDRCILSKGHGALALYAAMKQAGYIQQKELVTYKSNETFLTGHPSMCIERGIEFSSGSLGQGLSLGVGTALALKKKNDYASRVFVLLGDGECDEGSIWEAAMSAAHYGLNNLVTIIDKNDLQYDGRTEDVMSKGNLFKKWDAFGWNVVEVNGHDTTEIYNALSIISDKPIAIIANTIKGKGISFMENNPAWHYGRLSEMQYKEAMLELGGR